MPTGYLISLPIWVGCLILDAKMRIMGLDQPVGVDGAYLGGEVGGDEECGAWVGAEGE